MLRLAVSQGLVTSTENSQDFDTLLTKEAVTITVYYALPAALMRSYLIVKV